ncbi:MAG: DUF5996 family protein [Phycisphaeraceae bacterium]
MRSRSTTIPVWPALPYAEWRETCTTLHLWLQVVGKVRLAQTPWVNHSWHATLYVTASGLTTGPIPHGQRSFQIDFDLIEHVLRFRTSDDQQQRLPLAPQPVATFASRVLETLDRLGLPVHIRDVPSEMPDPIPFHEDHVHREYDREAAHRFWQALVQVDRVFRHFRTGFIGKVSPVHLFWGALDLAVTRFSGRRAPLHPGGVPGLPDEITREAYSHEVSSAGFWPGGGGIDYPAFYSYAYPEPDGFRTATIHPEQAFYEPALGEFVLPYDVVRQADDPDATLLQFLQSAYDAAAERGGWPRTELECPLGRPGVPRPI